MKKQARVWSALLMIVLASSIAMAAEKTAAPQPEPTVQLEIGAQDVITASDAGGGYMSSDLDAPGIDFWWGSGRPLFGGGRGARSNSGKKYSTSVASSFSRCGGSSYLFSGSAIGLAMITRPRPSCLAR
jgi:hypothetical protein